MQEGGGLAELYLIQFSYKNLVINDKNLTLRKFIDSVFNPGN